MPPQVRCRIRTRGSPTFRPFWGVELMPRDMVRAPRRALRLQTRQPPPNAAAVARLRQPQAPTLARKEADGDGGPWGSAWRAWRVRGGTVPLLSRPSSSLVSRAAGDDMEPTGVELAAGAERPGLTGVRTMVGQWATGRGKSSPPPRGPSFPCSTIPHDRDSSLSVWG